MNYVQELVSFSCDDEWLLAIISRPRQPHARGVLILVGGPQYRVGSHRQFISLARYLATQGIPTMRFDYRGMGDSTGDRRDFEQVTPDLRAAVDAFFRALPDLREVVVWGLCDAASAALLYAYGDARVTGLVLLNPWVRTAESEAKAYLRHYYARRIVSPALWRKIFRGEFDAPRATRSLSNIFRRVIRTNSIAEPACSGTEQSRPHQFEALPARMEKGLEHFTGGVLLILSGRDLTAREFEDVTGASKRWRRLLSSPRVTRYMLPAATHTFSRREWRDQVAAWTAAWVRSW